MSAEAIWLIILGLIISIPLVVFGATMILALLTRYPILVWAGAALLGWVAGELIATEPAIAPYMQQMAQQMGVTMPTLAKIFEAVGALIVVIAGLILSRMGGGHSEEKHAAKH